jgi:hypothetical protein
MLFVELLCGVSSVCENCAINLSTMSYRLAKFCGHMTNGLCYSVNCSELMVVVEFLYILKVSRLVDQSRLVQVGHNRANVCSAITKPEQVVQCCLFVFGMA